MQNASEPFKNIIERVQSLLANESSGHDFSHAQRVFNNALYLQKHEGGDFFVIGAAALVHDMCRPWEKKTGKLHFGPEALVIIGDVLRDCGVDSKQASCILDVVAEHDVYDWMDKNFSKSIELQIVQDADNLDAIGAIGIARTFAFGGAQGLSMYNPGENLKFGKDFVEDPNHRTTTIAHFYEKLLKLNRNMNTSTGKKLGEKRQKIMEDFLSQFFKEWNGDF